MLSRLKRKPPAQATPPPPQASASPAGPTLVLLDDEDDDDGYDHRGSDHDHDHPAASPTSTRSARRDRRSTSNTRSFTTPIKGRAAEHDSLSPTRHRAYTTSPEFRQRPTSRTSSFTSSTHDRPSSIVSDAAIGQGSLSLDHLAPPDGHAHGPGLTLVVQAPELLLDTASNAPPRLSSDDHNYDHHHPGDDGPDSLDTPTDARRGDAHGFGSDQRTPLAVPEPVFDGPTTTTTRRGGSPSAPTSPDGTSSLSPEHARVHQTRPRAHTSSEAIRGPGGAGVHARQHRASENGLDALAAINRGTAASSSSSTTDRAPGRTASSIAAVGHGSGSGSRTASPPSMSRASSRGAGGGGSGSAAHSRPLSRSSSVASHHQQPPTPTSDPHGSLRPGLSTGRSYSPTRGRKPSPSVSTGSNAAGEPKSGMAGALAWSGVALASPGAGASSRPPHGLVLGAATTGDAAGNAAEGETGRGSGGVAGAARSGPAAAVVPATPPMASARTSLESHIGPLSAGAGGLAHSPSAADELDGQGPSSVYRTYSHHSGGGNATVLDHTAGALLSMDHLGEYDDVVSQLGTGYAVASSKRNADFHALFKNVPDDDYLIEDYGCALQREILIQGRLYISEHHLSFYANIFGWVTSLVIPFSEVCSIEKRMTAYVIPNAIQVATMHARHTFASFLSRDTTYDLIGHIWRMVHPVIPLSAALPDALSTSTSRTGLEPPDSDDETSPVGGATANSSGIEVAHSGSTEGVGSRAKRRLKGLRRPRGGTGESAQGGKSVVDGRGGGDARTSASGSGGGGAGADGLDDEEEEEGAGDSLGKKKNKKGKKEKGASAAAAAPVHAPTVDTCPTLKNLKEVCMDAQFPGAPEKIYNLMFTSGFMKGFWAENQKLTEIQIGDWAPQASGSNLLARSMSYIKPLNGSIGPRQTKCMITDESAHVDFDDFVCVVTTTRTPDVPSGSAFSVKTRTSMTWAKGNHCRVVVTTGVEWTKSSFIKGIIEKSAIDGQKQYHSDLEKAMRAYISTHRNEFVEEGQDPDDHSSDLDSIDGVAATAAATAEDGVDASVAAELAAADAQKGLLRFLAPVWSALEPVFEHLAHQTPQSLLLGGVVAILVLSNLWTLRGVNQDLHPAERARRRAAGEWAVAQVGSAPAPAGGLAAPPLGGGSGQHPNDVANAVRDVLHHYFAAQQHAAATASPVIPPSSVAGPPTPEPAGPAAGDADDGPSTSARDQDRVGALQRELDALEARVRALKQHLGSKQPVDVVSD